jgi:hypothetical protein
LITQLKNSNLKLAAILSDGGCESKRTCGIIAAPTNSSMPTRRNLSGRIEMLGKHGANMATYNRSTAMIFPTIKRLQGRQPMVVQAVEGGGQCARFTAQDRNCAETGF